MAQIIGEAVAGNVAGNAVSTPANLTDVVDLFQGDGTTNVITWQNLVIAIGARAAADLANVQLAYTVGGKVPGALLDFTALQFQGDYNAGTNTPALTNAGGTQNHVYRVVNSANPTNKDFGAGGINISDDEYIAYAGASGSGAWINIGQGATKQIAEGGTGATTAAAARTSLDLFSRDEIDDRALSRAPLNGVYLDGEAGHLSLGDDPLLEFGDASADSPLSESFGIRILSLANAFIMSSKATGSAPNNERAFLVGTDGKLEVIFYDESTGVKLSVKGDTVLTVDKDYVVSFSYDGSGAEGGIRLVVNQTEQAKTSTSAGSYTAMHPGTAQYHIGRQSGTYAKGIIRSNVVHNRALSLAEQQELGANNNQPREEDKWAGATSTSGTLVKGKRYRIKTFVAGDDFTNVGAASNATGVEFVATGTTPTTWTNSSTLLRIGAINSAQGRNVLPNGNINDESANKLNATSSGATPVFRPTGGQFSEEIELAHSSISSSAATTKLIDLAAGCRVVSVETIVTAAFDALTTLDIGISGSASKYASAIDVASTGRLLNSNSNASESDTAATAVYAQKNQATTQGNAKFRIVYEITAPAV